MSSSQRIDAIMKCHSHGPSSRRSGNLRKSRSSVFRQKANQPSRQSNEGHKVSSADIPLPQGVWWLKHANVKQEAAYGPSFVIHRPEMNPTELVKQPDPVTLQVWSPTMLFRPHFPLLPPKFDSDAEIVEVEWMPIDTSSSALVLQGIGPVCEDVHEPSSPRRTQKIKFTCNRCQTQTEKFVNPHAWHHGVVFCRCDGCAVVHLIRDQKGVFSCLKGPLFPQTMDLKKIKIPKGLHQNPSMPKYSEGDDTSFSLF